MKLFDNIERRGVVTLLPLLIIVLLLTTIIEIMEEPKILQQPEQTKSSVPIHEFNPNVDEYEELRDAGLPTDVAVGIVRWRRYGKVYRIKEDLTQVSGMTDSLYAILKPYIIIADSLAPHPLATSKYSPKRDRVAVKSNPTNSATDVKYIYEKFLIDTVSSSYLTRWGFSPKQADAIIRYRDACGGIYSVEQFNHCYVVSEQMAKRITPYIIFSESHDDAKLDTITALQTKLPVERLVEINGADSATLVAINGIGPKSATEIIKYRKLLGGYHSVEQIAELNCVTESNFEKILQQIWCDSFIISKIDINFAGPKELERHPYVSARTLRRIIKQRQLKGGWSRIEEMVEQNILSEEEAKRLAPYLRFGPRATE